MPFPLATIGLTLAAAGLKLITGPEDKLLDFAAHPVDLLAGHLLASNAEEVAERLRERFKAYERIENEDLDRAVMQSVVLASLFCLLDALPTEPAALGPWSHLRKRFEKWLPEVPLQGAISQAEESVLRPAIEACIKRVKDAEAGAIVPAEIDPLGLILPESGQDWGAQLANEALADIRREHPNLPKRLDGIFQQRWFSCLCLAFQEQIKTNERVSRIFQAVQTATGFAHLEDVVRDENKKTLSAIEALRSVSTGLVPVRPDNLPHRDRYFQGRKSELLELRQLLQSPTRAVTLAACQGLGGQGKTALALEYAHVRADDYPGGCVLLQAEAQANLDGLLRSLVPLLFHPDTSPEQLKPILALSDDAFLGWVSPELRTRERVLFILDNVDNPALLALKVLDRLPGAEHLHLLVTTRLEPAHFSALPHVEVDKLPQADALALVRAYRALVGDEKNAAIELVTRLDGYAIAVEAAAAWLSRNPALTVRQFVEALQAGGLKSFEETPGVDRLALSRHRQSQLSSVLAPIFQSLNPLERETLAYAALMPPDCVPLPWLRDLVNDKIPEAMPFMAEPWAACVARLDGLRLLRADNDLSGAVSAGNSRTSPSGVAAPAVVSPAAATPVLARMHRLVQELTVSTQEHEEKLAAYAVRRADMLHQNWVNKEAHWEMEPLRRLTRLFLEQDQKVGPDLTDLLQDPLRGLNRSADSRDLLQRAIENQEKHFDRDPSRLAISYSNLALVERDLGNLREAKQLSQRTIEIQEKHFQPDSPEVSISYSNLAYVEWNLGNFSEAKRLWQRAIEIQEKHFEPDDPRLAVRYSNLALVEHDLDNLSEAKRLSQRAIEIQEKHFESDHPTLAVRYSILARVERDLRNFSEAKRLSQRAIEIGEKLFAPDHPTLGTYYSNLATVEHNLGNLADAKRLLQRAIEIGEKHFQPDHPKLATTYSYLALVEKDLSNLPEARRLLQRAIEIQERHFEPDHPNLALAYFNLATVEQDTGNDIEAQKLARRAEEILLKHFTPEHPRVRKVRDWLGRHG